MKRGRKNGNRRENGGATLIRKQKTVCYDFVFKRSPVHLKPFEHGATTIYEDLSLEKILRKREITDKVTGPLRAINAQRNKHSARFATPNDLQELA